MREKHVAIIDLGSNTARLIVMAYVPGYSYRLIDEIREVVRLREGMAASGAINPVALQRALFTLRLFRQFCSVIEADHVIATATSAVREASNGPAFVKQVREDIGLDLHVLSGEREGYFGAIGALTEYDIQQGYVLDIGGGSAQISRIEERRPVESVSVTLGALALTERFVSSDPITADEYEAVQMEIARQLNTIPWLGADSSSTLIGIGGSIRNLARIEAKRTDYPLETLHGYRLQGEALASIIARLRKHPLEKRQQIRGLSIDRADIILPGAMVAAEVMERLGVGDMAISVSGLREGLFADHFWQGSLPHNVSGFHTVNMARIYEYQKDHAEHVQGLAGQLFDQLKPLHGWGPAERALLDAAALLHDIGTLINYDDHHKHSKTLIENSGLPGFTPREVALIALLTRYHRKGTPDFHDYGSLMQEGDLTRLKQLAAILRLAEYMERGRNGIIKNVHLRWDDETLFLTLEANVYPAVELWAVGEYATPLMEEAFNRQLALTTTAEWPATAPKK